MFQIKGVGGISLDLPDRETPAEFVHVAQNISASHGKYAASFGFRTVENNLPEAIIHLLSVNDSQWRRILLLSGTKAYSWDGGDTDESTSEIVDITNVPLVPATEGERYSSDTINGLGVFAIEVDYPRAWGNPQDSTDKIQDLPFSASETWRDKNLRTGIIRNYKNYLVTLGEDDSVRNNSRKVRWSASVTDTSVLPYWEPIPENDAGFVTLSDLNTGILDGRPLGDTFIIYAHDSAYAMTWVGGQYIMKFQRLNSLPGVMAKNLVMPFENSHFVVGSTDIYAHSGGAPASLVDRRIREIIFDRLNAENVAHVFLTKNWQMQEIWLCVGDIDGATDAFVWSWKDLTWTTRSIPKSYYGVSGVTPVAHMTWDTMPYESWNVIPGTWTGLGPKGTDLPEMIFTTIDETLTQRDTGVLDGVECDCLIERTGITIGDYRKHLTLLTVYPNIAKSPATLEVGMQYFEDGPIDWSAPQEFDPITDKHMDVRGDNLTGSLFCYRIYNTEPSLFEFTGLELELAEAGKD